MFHIWVGFALLFSLAIRPYSFKGYPMFLITVFFKLWWNLQIIYDIFLLKFSFFNCTIHFISKNFETIFFDFSIISGSSWVVPETSNFNFLIFGFDFLFLDRLSYSKANFIIWSFSFVLNKSLIVLQSKLSNSSILLVFNWNSVTALVVAKTLVSSFWL